MRETLRVSLDEHQICQACEAFVSQRVKPDEQARAVIDATSGVKVTVIVTKKRIRKAKNGG